ncbi:MAG: hypothetical protein QOH97_3030 [Actinoplanes sp.]|jgi:hypothetical protein|nr:hypothetical protein [Actinoplanes sp.]
MSLSDTPRATRSLRRGLGPDRHGNTHCSRRARGSRQIPTLSVAGNSCSDYLAALPDTAATRPH